MTITIASASRPLRYSALALAMGLAFASTGAFAQSNTTGSIFGQVAAKQGTTVLVENTETGFTRTATVDDSGRYRFSTLPVGKYKVTLQNNGSAVSTRDNIVVAIASGAEVSFGAAAASGDAKNLEGVSVVAAALPAIDVSSVDTRTVLTGRSD